MKKIILGISAAAIAGAAGFYIVQKHRGGKGTEGPVSLNPPAAALPVAAAIETPKEAPKEEPLDEAIKPYPAPEPWIALAEGGQNVLEEQAQKGRVFSKALCARDICILLTADQVKDLTIVFDEADGGSVRENCDAETQKRWLAEVNNVDTPDVSACVHQKIPADLETFYALSRGSENCHVSAGFAYKGQIIPLFSETVARYGELVGHEGKKCFSWESNEDLNADFSKDHPQFRISQVLKIGERLVLRVVDKRPKDDYTTLYVQQGDSWIEDNSL